ncbi:MAG: 2-oxoacid:ferredoxin oxidoreductase subunit beta [Armatimonadetes bacterium]|nr:2-oxoacid:ferredoxin oxidoreductase subunit beta [Armatimonadota bacterium]
MSTKGIKLWDENAVPRHQIQWCPGCGDFAVLAGLKQALTELEIMPHELMMCGGIGCSGQIRNYLNGNAFHGTHGGALAYALGVKMTNPELKVITLAGDGDTLAIGVENFVHVCRRDPDMVLLIMNNGVYGLTKGQSSPTGGLGQTFETFSEEKPPMVDPLLLALASEATFVAQSFSGDVKHGTKVLVEAFQHKGFSLVNDFSPCVTYNKFNTYEWFREHVAYVPDDHDVTSVEAAQALVRDFARRGKVPLGVIYKNPRRHEPHNRLPIWTEQLENVDRNVVLASYR